jgi:hypothetical protein
MSDAWLKTYDELCGAIDEMRVGPLFFRGHHDASWRLLPTLARTRDTTAAQRNMKTAERREHNVFTLFISHAGSLIPPTSDSWDVAFLMQHHGLPTRLLDWTTTFSVALYFAVKGATGDAAIWILNGAELNRRLCGKYEILHPHDLDHGYANYFIDRSNTLSAPVAALYPLRHQPRVFHQRGGFTLHRDLTRSLDEIEPDVVRKVVIPSAAQPGARRFLQMAGISEFTLFPDLDGLARELNEFFF